MKSPHAHAASGLSDAPRDDAVPAAAAAIAAARMEDVLVAASAQPPDPTPALLNLSTLATTAADAAAASEAAGMAALRDEATVAALRTALYVQGSVDTTIAASLKRALAARFIHSRIIVDEHTAGAVLWEAFTVPKVLILRDFPGAVPPAVPSVTALLSDPPSGDGVAYKFNLHGTQVHCIFMTFHPDTSAARKARAWWDTVNLLPDTGTLQDQSAGVVWNFISRRGKTTLHVDDGDGTSTQWQGKKLWVFAKKEEAASHGIHPLSVDPMRDPAVGTHRFTDWLACDSFCWCVLHPGDTVVQSREWLHAVCCIGDEDSVSSASYCWLKGTAPLPLDELQPMKSLKRKQPPAASPAPLPSAAPLSIVQHAAAAAPSHHSSPVQRIAAAALMDDGQTAAAAATKADISPSIARRWHKRLKTAASADDAVRSGRPPKTDAVADAAIVRASQLDPFASNKQIRAQLALPISSDTVGRRLDAAALPSRFAAKKQHYTDEQRRARLSFANGYKHWTAEQWERVIFSDEVTIEGDGRKRHVRVRRPDGHRFDPQYTLHSRIFTPSRHLFACFCSRGPGFCEMYEGKLDGKALRGLLERTVPETARDYYQTDPSRPGFEPWWLLHDGSPVFRSGEVQRWLHNNAINVIDWPPYSPDLNPIESLWPRVHALMDQLCPTTDEAVADAFVECWPELSLDLFTDYAQSMPARIAAVIAANGDATKY
jgi:transposase